MADPTPLLVSLPIAQAKALLRLIAGPEYLLRECLVIATMPDIDLRGGPPNPVVELKRAIEEAEHHG